MPRKCCIPGCCFFGTIRFPNPKENLPLFYVRLSKVKNVYLNIFIYLCPIRKVARKIGKFIKTIISATELTAYRTAAASLIATYYIFKTYCRESMVLAIFGAGVQGEVHADAFICCLNFKEVRILDTKLDRAQNLAQKLNDKFEKKDLCKAFGNREDCLKDADVIITTTSSEQTTIKKKWLKDKVHINAVGTGCELEDEIYCTSDLYLDSWTGAQSELEDLIALNSPIKGEVGDVINLKVHPSEERRSIFQSLGMAAQDCAIAKLVYDLHQNMKKDDSTQENSETEEHEKNGDEECAKDEMGDMSVKTNLKDNLCDNETPGDKGPEKEEYECKEGKPENRKLVKEECEIETLPLPGKEPKNR